MVKVYVSPTSEKHLFSPLRSIKYNIKSYLLYLFHKCKKYLVIHLDIIWAKLPVHFACTTFTLVNTVARCWGLQNTSPYSLTKRDDGGVLKSWPRMTDLLPYRYSEYCLPRTWSMLLAESPGENKGKCFKKKWMQPLHGMVSLTILHVCFWIYICFNGQRR